MWQLPLHEFLKNFPKCEQHLHLARCLTPKLVFELAAKNSIRLPDPVTRPEYAPLETHKQKYQNSTNLEEFLRLHGS
jgi:adenosine deaminase